MRPGPDVAIVGGALRRGRWWVVQLAASWSSPEVGYRVTAPFLREPSVRMAVDGLWPGEQEVLAPFVRPDLRVLDVGCGAGREALALARLGARVVAIDPDLALIERGRELLRGHDVELRVGALPALSPDLVGFDVVYLSSDVYCTLPGGRAARVAALRACRAALEPGGVVVWPVHVRQKTLATRWLLDEPRRALRRLGHTRGAAPGERFFRDPPDGTLHLKHVFTDRAQVLDEARAAGLEPLAGSGSYFTVRRPPAPIGPFAPAPQVEAAAHEGSLIVANLATGATFRLNATGARIWARVVEGATRASIVEKLATSPGVSPEVVDRDVTQLLETLLERGLIVCGEARA